METITENQLHELAQKRVGFRMHLLVYCVVNAALWIMWYATGHGYLWPIWPLGGWGIVIVFHYMFEYRTSKFLSEAEEYRKLKKEMDEHQRKSSTMSAD
jgi:hypothetical protein